MKRTRIPIKLQKNSSRTFSEHKAIKKLITSTVMSLFKRRLRDSNSRTRITRSTPLARAPLQPLE